MKTLLWTLGLALLLPICRGDTVLRCEATVLARMFKSTAQSEPVEDGILFRVCILNDGDSDVILPAKIPHQDVVESDEVVTITYNFMPFKMASKAKSYLIIPSKEALAPVVLKPGECMFTDFVERRVRHGGILTKPVRVIFTTKGFLAERFGFTSVDLKAETKASLVTHSPDAPLL